MYLREAPLVTQSHASASCASSVHSAVRASMTTERPRRPKCGLVQNGVIGAGTSSATPAHFGSHAQSSARHPTSCMPVSRTHCRACPMVNWPHGNRFIKSVRPLGIRARRASLYTSRSARSVPCDYRAWRIEISRPDQSRHRSRRNAGGLNARACGCNTVTTPIVNHGGHWYARRNPSRALDSSTHLGSRFDLRCPSQSPPPNLTSWFRLENGHARNFSQTSMRSPNS
jgi:hypothetical protein